MNHASIVVKVCAAILWAPMLTQSCASAQTVELDTVGAAGAAQPADAPLNLSLEDAIHRANALSPALKTALTNAKIAAEDHCASRARRFCLQSPRTPSICTPKATARSAARYIANNGVHEYIAQGDAHEALSVPLLIAHRRSVVLASLARDEAEIAQRGLVVAVVESYATLVAANGKLDSAKEALDAAGQFLKVTQELEKGGEVADADVVKAQLQMSDSEVMFRSFAARSGAGPDHACPADFSEH